MTVFMAADKRDGLALFDFCETLVDFQTADAYVDFVRERLMRPRMMRLEQIQCFLRSFKLIQILERLTGYRLSLNKRLKLYQLRGISRSDLDECARAYYNEIICRRFIKPVLGELVRLKSVQGYDVYLVSGGYDIYLNYFVKDYLDPDRLICSRIGFSKDDRCTGRMVGIDCLGHGKITLINGIIDKSRYEDSVAYSDSESDLPLLRFVDRGIVVSRSNSQAWAAKNKMMEMIWEERE